MTQAGTGLVTRTKSGSQDGHNEFQIKHRGGELCHSGPMCLCSRVQCTAETCLYHAEYQAHL